MRFANAAVTTHLVLDVHGTIMFHLCRDPSSAALTQDLHIYTKSHIFTAEDQNERVGFTVNT